MQDAIIQPDLNKWDVTAGPRQFKNTEKALRDLLSAGSGTLYKKTSTFTGADFENVVHSPFSLSRDEEIHKKIVRNAYNALHDKFKGELTRANHKEIIAEALTAAKGLDKLQPVIDERKNPDELDVIKKIQREESARRDAERAEKDRLRELAAQDQVSKYPHLTPINEDHAGGVKVAPNVRKALKKEFPTTKFSVTSDHSSINISWELGPSSKQVNAVALLFQAGTFDGMTDSSDWKPSAFNDAFGGVRFVFCNRKMPDGLWERVKASLCELVECPDWDTERTISALLHSTDLRGKGEFVRVYDERENQDCPHVIEYALEFEEVESPKESTVNASASWTIEEHTHTKTGTQIFICVLSERVDKETFAELRQTAKAGGGWYSRKWADAPAGFAFNTMQAAEYFKEAVGGGNPTEPTPDNTPKPSKTNNASKGTATAERLRTMADKMQATIDQKTAPMTQNPTPKRSVEYRRRLIEGDHLARVQEALRLLAGLHEGGEVPELLRTVTTKKELLILLRTTTRSGGYYDIQDTGEFPDTTPKGLLLQSLLKTGLDPEKQRLRDIKSKELDLVGLKIPGFFPTPKKVTELMLEFLDIQEGDSVLEPSAGSGNLAEAAREAGGDVVCFEINKRLCDILKLKGFKAHHMDFMEATSDNGYLPTYYDKIIMNPPFEKGQDIHHVSLAYNKLKEGGSMAAIMGEGVFFRTDLASECFREWLDEVGGVSEQLPEGSFKGTGEVSQTGTNTRLVIICK